MLIEIYEYISQHSPAVLDSYSSLVSGSEVFYLIGMFPHSDGLEACLENHDQMPNIFSRAMDLKLKIGATITTPAGDRYVGISVPA